MALQKCNVIFLAWFWVAFWKVNLGRWISRGWNFQGASFAGSNKVKRFDSRIRVQNSGIQSLVSRQFAHHSFFFFFFFADSRESNRSNRFAKESLFWSTCQILTNRVFSFDSHSDSRDSRPVPATTTTTATTYPLLTTSYYYLLLLTTINNYLPLLNTIYYCLLVQLALTTYLLPTYFYLLPTYYYLLLHTTYTYLLPSLYLLSTSYYLLTPTYSLPAFYLLSTCYYLLPLSTKNYFLLSTY